MKGKRRRLGVPRVPAAGLADLPSEVVREGIARRLDAASVLALASTCRRFRGELGGLVRERITVRGYEDDRAANVAEAEAALVALEKGELLGCVHLDVDDSPAGMRAVAAASAADAPPADVELKDPGDGIIELIEGSARGVGRAARGLTLSRSKGAIRRARFYPLPCGVAFPALERLSLEGIEEFVGFSDLSEAWGDTLRVLEIRDSEPIRDELPRPMPRLEAMTIRVDSIRTRLEMDPGDFPNLEVLDLGALECASIDELFGIARLEKLRSVSIAASDLDEDPWPVYEKLVRGPSRASLRRVDIDVGRALAIDDERAEVLAAAPALDRIGFAEIDLEGCGLPKGGLGRAVPACLWIGAGGRPDGASVENLAAWLESIPPRAEKLDIIFARGRGADARVALAIARAAAPLAKTWTACRAGGGPRRAAEEEALFSPGVVKRCRCPFER